MQRIAVPVACPQPASALADCPGRLLHAVPNALHPGRALVFLPRPEEAAESVFLAARHDVDMQMRHALAHAVVDRHKRAFTLHGLLHGSRQEPGVAKQRTGQFFGQVRQCLIRRLGDQQARAGKQRPVVQKGERQVVFEDRSRRHIPRHNPAKRAGALHPAMLPLPVPASPHLRVPASPRLPVPASPCPPSPRPPPHRSRPALQLQPVEVVMALLVRIQELLDRSGVAYTHTVHPLAYTAREVAAAEHLPAQEVAKVVVFLAENGYRMVVLPANKVVDFQELRTMLGFSHARLATEKELSQLFPDCDLGAMPPFGNLYGMPVYLDSSLLSDEQIAFNAGTHRDVVHVRLDDFRQMVNPEVVSLAREVMAHGGW